MTISKYFVLILFAVLITSCNENGTIVGPAPTDTVVKLDMENGEFRDLKREWKKMIFRTPEGTNAEYIEAINSWNAYKAKLKLTPSKTPEDIIANGKIIGTWEERGSKNQSGSIFVTEYDAETQEIYTVAAGGPIFKGKADGSQWEVVNEKLRFHEQFLDLVRLEDGTKRLLAAIANKPHYSDDGGITWTPSSGFNPAANGQIRHCFTNNDSLGYTYFMGKTANGVNISLYQSKDKGETYKALTTFATTDMDILGLSICKNSHKVFILEKTSETFSKVHELSADQTNIFIKKTNSPFSFKNARGNLVSTHIDSTTYMYAYNSENKVYLSTDIGKTWTEQGALLDSPWGVGLLVSSTDPDFLMVGAVNCARSLDGGKTWAIFNDWPEYTDDKVHKFHADMMYFNEFSDSITGENFFLISTHGGIYKLDNPTDEPTNISLLGLNVSQYYSVRTSINGDNYIYAGAQDQGFQRAFNNKDGLLDFNQVVTGDYGHIIFTGNGSHLWTVYPGGTVHYYKNPTAGGVDLSYKINSEDETVWIPPLANSSNEDLDLIYMAGGSIDGGPGSYLISLIPEVGQISATQFDFDFKAASGGTISAIATAGDFDEFIYIATTNGKFFYSDDYGDNFAQSAMVNGGHYLYGSKIIPSKLNTDIIYTGGTGYNGVPAMRSTDGGQSFSAFGNGLPNTTILDMAINQEETLLFAATTSGPFVCILSEEKWYDMTGEHAPNVVYWSVELANDEQTVRFGTYARGIFDFDISVFVNQKQEKLAEQELTFYPNPVSEIANIEWPENASNQAFIYDNQGKLVKEVNRNNQKQSSINLADLISGNYFLQYQVNQQNQSIQFIKI